MSAGPQRAGPWALLVSADICRVNFSHRIWKMNDSGYDRAVHYNVRVHNPILCERLTQGIPFILHAATLRMASEGTGSSICFKDPWIHDLVKH